MAGLVALVAMVYGFWILIQFIDVVHGGDSAGRAVVVFLFSMLAVGILLSLPLVFFEFQLELLPDV